MEPFFNALLAFDNQFASYQKVIDAAAQAFGPGQNFRPLAVQKINEMEATKRTEMLARWNVFDTYDKAINAWNTANQFVQQPQKYTRDMIEGYMPLFEQYLPSFGDNGKKLLSDVKTKFSTLAPAPTSASDASGGSGSVPADPLARMRLSVPKQTMTAEERTEWDFNHYLMLERYYDDTLNRVSARCIQLGGLERTQYPFFPYVLDVLHELISEGRKISKDSKFDELIKGKYPGQAKGFQQKLSEYSNEFTMNAPEEMLDENVKISDMIKTIGRLDMGPAETDIGAAPDGFDAEKDLPGAPPPPPVRKIKDMGGLKQVDGSGKFADLEKPKI